MSLFNFSKTNLFVSTNAMTSFNFQARFIFLTEGKNIVAKVHFKISSQSGKCSRLFCSDSSQGSLTTGVGERVKNGSNCTYDYLDSYSLTSDHLSALLF